MIFKNFSSFFMKRMLQTYQSTRINISDLFTCIPFSYSLSSIWWLYLLSFVPLQFKYTMDMSQLRFLRLFRSSAFQNVAFHCRNTTAYYDTSTKFYRRAAIHLMNASWIIDSMKSNALIIWFRENEMLKIECQQKTAHLFDSNLFSFGSNWATLIFLNSWFH